MVPTPRSLHPQEGDPPPSPPCQPRANALDAESACDRARAQLFMSANDPMVVIDISGNYLDANPAACQHLRYSRDELLGLKAWQIRGVTEEAWQDFFAETLKLGRRIVETEHHRRDGKVLPVEVSLRAIAYEGRPAVLSIARNIELRQTVQAELVRRNLELATLLANTSGLEESPVFPSGSCHNSASELEHTRVLATNEERNRLGRELHDHLVQSLASAVAYADVAQQMLNANQSTEAAWAVGKLAGSLQQAYAELREAIHALRDAELLPGEWVDSLSQYISRYEQQWGIRCELQVDDAAAAACDAAGRLDLTRILQEALTNVRKHAGAKRASISIVLEDGAVLARVSDEGRGFNAAGAFPGHYGLETMRERTQAMGGELSITSGPTGTQVCVRVPGQRLS